MIILKLLLFRHFSVKNCKIHSLLIKLGTRMTHTTKSQAKTKEQALFCPDQQVLSLPTIAFINIIPNTNPRVETNIFMFVAKLLKPICLS